MNQKQLEEKRLKQIISGMQNKGYSTKVIRLNLVVSFLIMLIIFSFPYTLINLNMDNTWGFMDIIVYAFGTCFIFFLMQYLYGKKFPDNFPLVKALRDFQPISKKHFIQKHMLNFAYSIVVLIIGFIFHKFILCSIACYLIAFDYPHLFLKVLFSKTSDKAYLVYYPTAFRGALLFDSLESNKD